MAVWPPEDVLDAIKALPRPSLPGVRWTARDQWHVTLRFLGEAHIGEVTKELDRLSAASVQATLAPKTRRLGRGVLCIPVAGLDELAAAVIEATALVGRPPEHRAFRGHVTLARVDGRARPPLAAVPALSWTVATFALVRSHLGGGPARYETVASWPLHP